MPKPVDALPCGSRSTISTCSPIAASAVPRLIAVVVLPTPPFWLATARTRGRAGGSVRCAGRSNGTTCGSPDGLDGEESKGSVMTAVPVAPASGLSVAGSWSGPGIGLYTTFKPAHDDNAAFGAGLTRAL